MTKNRETRIGDTVVEPGTRAEIMLPVADLYTATSLGMPVQVVSGRKAGPGSGQTGMAEAGRYGSP